jgi:hypothetical protein
MQMARIFAVGCGFAHMNDDFCPGYCPLISRYSHQPFMTQLQAGIHTRLRADSEGLNLDMNPWVKS